MAGRWSNSSLYGGILSVSLLWIGCATSPPPLPEGASPPPAPVREQPSEIKQETTGPSSLEAVRKGQAPVTPASSPLKEIYFDFDRYHLRPDARETLKVNANWLRANPSVRVEIEGHADERGTSEYNLALGARRAEAAKDYLVTLGISAERLSTISYGEELPVCKEKIEECRHRNRRGRFVVIPGRPAS